MASSQPAFPVRGSVSWDWAGESVLELWLGSHVIGDTKRGYGGGHVCGLDLGLSVVRWGGTRFGNLL